jgi:hypothetical protein
MQAKIDSPVEEYRKIELLNSTSPNDQANCATEAISGEYD